MSGERFEFGIFTFGERTRRADGSAVAPRERLEEVLRWARTADQAGLDVVGVGEHHRSDFAISSPPVVLAAIARETARVQLTSTVTVLSSADPVRVFEDFATVDLLSDGRAEITAGRGAYLESFPLFGLDLERYDEYFEDRLDLLLALRRDEDVTWSGTTRAPLDSAPVHPRPVGDLPVWVAVGGTSQSVVRSGRLGLPTYLAVLGAPDRFAPLAELYRRSAAGRRRRAWASRATSTQPRPHRARATSSTSRTPGTSGRTCRGSVASTDRRSGRGPGRAARSWSGAPRRSSTRSCGSTRSSGTTASSRRWVSARSRRTPRSGRSSCSRPRSLRRSAQHSGTTE
ncbi:LLM class flavin-dependent oxidoreductase [Curtobacterium sp. 24E2]|nr:LLM class flavin-dependent oxidoreductase [Curtobacterium sp. 24E2]